VNLDQVQLVMIRGLPGSGKSTLAKEIVSAGFEHVENDQFFICGDQYAYDRQRLGDAIQWCEDKTRRLLTNGQKVVVANSFVRIEHMRRFFDMVYTRNRLVIECRGEFGSIHDVPDGVMNRLRADWEDYPKAIQISEKQPT